MAMDGNGNSHEPAGTPKGGQFARKAGQGTDDDIESLVDHGTRRDTLDRTGSMTDDEKRQADLLLDQVRATGRYDMDVDDLTEGQCEYIARSEMDRQLDQDQLERHGFRIKPTRGYGKTYTGKEPWIRAGVTLERDGEEVSLEYAWEGEDPASAYWCLNTRTGDYDELGGYFAPEDLDAETVERNWGVLSSCASHQALEELGCYGVYAVDDYE